MDTMIDLAKQETLLAMYQSVDRMNEAVASGNQDVYQSECHLQQNLRRNFEDLSDVE
jgi:hypothetical protein